MQDTRTSGAAIDGHDTAVAQILASETFQKSPALRTLLKYLWEHRDEEPNEYQIAVDALGRKPDFNPKTDSTVRVQMLRVRQKLREYYEKEGAAEALRVHLPSGSHRLTIEGQPATEQPAPVAPPTARLPWILAACCAAIALAAVTYSVRRSPVAGSATSLPDFWRSFASNGKPVRIILPNLAFFRWPNNTVKVRDTRINGFEDLSKSPEMRGLIHLWGAPELMAHSYISAPDVYTASDLAAYLSRGGLQVSVVGHREAGFDQEGAFNRILIGNVQSGAHILPLLAGRNFEPISGFSFRNRQPRQGEPEVFPLVIESRRRETVPGVVYGLVTGSASTLVLFSENTTSLVRLLTTGDGLASVEKAGKPAGGFELLSVAEVEGGRVLRVRPKAFRTIP